MKRDLRGGVAVITGAASGIGRAAAVSLARRGVAVALCDRDAGGLASAAEDIRALGVAASTHVLDVADAAALAALPDAVLAEHGRVTVVVAAAGVLLAGRFEDVSMDEFRWLFGINVFGTVGLVKAFLPALMRERGHVVTISSLSGIIAPAGQVAYAASKFAVRGFSEALRHELGGTGVGLTVVHPGGVATSIARSARVAAASDAAAERARSDRFGQLFLKTPPEAVGEAIASAIEKRKPRLIVASQARLAVALQRLAPVRYWRLARWQFERVG